MWVLAAALAGAVTACAAPDTAPKREPQAPPMAASPAAQQAAASPPAKAAPAAVTQPAGAAPVRANPPPAPAKDTPVHRKVPVSPPSPDAPSLPPGERHGGSAVFVPRSIRPDEALAGRVPAASRVEADGRSIPVNAEGGFSSPAPHRSNSVINLSVKRSDDSRPPLTLKVQVLAD